MHAGTTDRGVLWRIEADVAERAPLTTTQAGSARLAVTLQLVVVFAALLLSIPTRSSRRAARAQSRIVGQVPQELLILPRRADDVDDESAAPDDTAPDDTAPDDATGVGDDEAADDDPERDTESERDTEPGEPDAEPTDTDPTDTDRHTEEQR